MYILKTRWENPHEESIWDQHLEIDLWMLYKITYCVCYVWRSDDATGHGKEKDMKVKVKIRQKTTIFFAERSHKVGENTDIEWAKHCWANLSGRYSSFIQLLWWNVLTKSNSWEKRFTWLILPCHCLLLRETETGTQGRNQKQEPWWNTVCWYAHRLNFS